MDMRQMVSLESYILDFDILQNKVEISKKQALLFFVGGLEIKIKNLVKMFKPETLEQAYKISRLQTNTFFSTQSNYRNLPTSTYNTPKHP